MRYPEAAVREWVAGVLAGIYAPRPNEEIWEWAERTLRIPRTENEEMAGRFWSSADSPYVRELMRWVRRPGKGEFWVKKSAQVGITMAVLIIICWMIVHSSGNVAYAIDTLTEARNISRTRLQKWITDNRLLEEMGEDPESVTHLTYYLRGLTVFMLGANSPGGMANKSIMLFILDELDKHAYMEGEGTTTELARERCKRPKNAKIIGFSTPGETDQITIEWRKGTQEEIRVPFPCCGHYQALKWEQFTFSTKEFRDLAGALDLAAVREGAYFKCELCGGRFEEKHKRAAFQLYQAVATNPKASPKVRSMHLWDAYSLFPAGHFGEIALKWLGAQGDVTLIERFMRGVRGEQHEKTGREVKHGDILKCRKAYKRGTCPFVPVLLCAAIDLQGDVQKAVKVAFDKHGNAYVIDWFISLVLSEAVEWCYEKVDGPDGQPLFITRALIDEGHRSTDVRRMCMANLPVFWPVKGRGGVQVRETIGTSYPLVDGQEICCYHVAEDDFKWQLLNMIVDRDKRTKRGEAIINFPEDADDDDDLIAEMCNERPVKKTRQNGSTRWEWETTGPNDFWDCVKYCLCEWVIMRPLLVSEGMAA